MLPVSCLLSKKIKAVASLFIICLLFSFHIREGATIKGNIHNAKDASPLPFVTVLEKGTKNITASDTEGVFAIRVSKLPALLVFSAVGFNSKEISVKDSDTEIIVNMNESAGRLDEVVVVGYGTEKVDHDYSISDFSAAEMKMPTAATRLEGKVSGISIRGASSVSGKARKSKSFRSAVSKKVSAASPSLGYERDSKETAVYDSLSISKPMTTQ